jgi:8-oxo-dGTP pyrophosphatase MutT (NUDIX family)
MGEPSFALARCGLIPHSTAMGAGSAARVSRASKLVRQRRQVAAVCYRAGKSGIEFLLVQTRSGRWIFPKGGVEPGLSHAQSAALEAFEEAGVHGRIEKISFARYFRCSPDASQKEGAVTAYLCEVFRLEAPQEANRNPAWFSAEKAKQRLRKGRPPEFGEELAHVVERAAARIQRLHGNSSTGPSYGAPSLSHPVPSAKDALQEVRFEAIEIALARGLAWSESYSRYIGREHGDLRAAGRGGSNRATLRLGDGSAALANSLQKVQFIDEVVPPTTGKPSARSVKNRRG